MRMFTGISVRHKDDPKAYRRAYYALNRKKLLAESTARGAVWRKKNGAHLRAHSAKYRHRLKMEAFAVLGGKCAACGFEDHRALQVDHIEQWPHSRAERVKAGEMGEKLYRKISRGLVTLENYQLLCANCNWIKREENNECKRKRALL